MKAVKIIFSVLIIFSLCTVHIFSQDCLWSSSAGGYEWDIAGWIVRDNNGNLFVGGGYSSNTIYFNTGTLQCFGKNDIFIVKYDQSGNEVWIKRLGGINTAGEGIGGMVFDTLNNRLLISGTFDGAFPLSDTVLQGVGQTVFILSMDPEGNVLWVRSAGGNGSDIANDITCDHQGNIYVCGVNEMEAVFQQEVIPRGGFLAKYDNNGNLIWAKNKFRYFSINPPYSFWPYTESEPINMLFVDNSIIVNGNKSNDTIVIDTISYITPSNSISAYLASFSLEGNVEWLKLSGETQGSCGVQMSSDGTGNIYITGQMYHQGPYIKDNQVSKPSITEECYLSKYSPTGSCLWTRNINASDMSRGSAVKSNHSGSSIYLSGKFRGEMVLGTTFLVSGYSQYGEMFIACYSSEGDCKDGRKYGKGTITSITLDQEENVCIAGCYEDSITIGQHTFPSKGDDDIFAAKCSPITGIIQPKSEVSNTLLIYANPNTGQCNVTIPEEFLNERNLQLQIFDQTGRLIREARVEMAGDLVKLDISAQAKGLYFAVLSNGKKSYQGKIVFE